jgi:hypothetical protein
VRRLTSKGLVGPSVVDSAALRVADTANFLRVGALLMYGTCCALTCTLVEYLC